MKFSFVSNNAMEILPIDKLQQSSSCWPLYCSLYAPKLWNPQRERQNWNNFVLFFHHSEAEESVAFVSYLPCRPLVSLIHNTCIGVHVYVYICVCVCVCIYVFTFTFTFIRAACGYCYATLVSPKRAPLYCCLYTLSIRPQQLSTIQPSVLLSPSKSRSSVLLTIQIWTCSAVAYSSTAYWVHILCYIHIVCISFIFLFIQNHPPPLALRSLPVTSIVQPQWHGSCRGSEIMQRQQNNASASKQCNQGEMYTRSASPSSGGSSAPLYSASHHCCKLLCGARQGIMPLLFIWAVYKRIMLLMQRLRPRWW